MTKQPVIWIIAGTTEGRKLVEMLRNCGVKIYVSVATEYGLSLLGNHENVHLLAQRLNQEEMTAFLQKTKPDCVIDATHPYAGKVTAYLSHACQETNTKYFRLLRPASGKGDFVNARDSEHAAELLKDTDGKVFLTCGSKELQAFTGIPGFAERLYVRILPTEESLAKCLSLGFKNAQIICMQGPFSKEMNIATLKATGASILVTKDSGEIGGYDEKMEAAQELGIPVIVIGRPFEEGEGMDFRQVIQKLIADYGLKIEGQDHSRVRRTAQIIRSKAEEILG